MKINKNGVLIEGMYLRVAPGEYFTSFEDSDGATITIDTATIMALADIINLDAELSNYNVNKVAEVKSVDIPTCNTCCRMDPKEICRARNSPVYGEFVAIASCPCEGLSYNQRS